MSYLGPGEDSEFDLLFRRLCYLSKVSLFFFVSTEHEVGTLRVFTMSPVCVYAITGVLACRQNASMHEIEDLISSPAGLGLTCRLKPDNPHPSRTLLQQLQRSLISLLTTYLSSRAEKAGGHLKWEEKKKSAREKESDEKWCYKKRKKRIWNLETAVRGNEVSNWSF